MFSWDWCDSWDNCPNGCKRPTKAASPELAARNTLASEAVLQAVMNAAHKAKAERLHIADILIKALEAGSIAGGDKRCGDQKATSAFITVAKPDDKKPYIDLLIFGQGKGNQNAVDLLRIKYDRWKRKHVDKLK